jgi:hypothetical protein
VVIVDRTERGDEMFMTSIARYAEQALDLDALELLPAPGSGRPAPYGPHRATSTAYPRQRTAVE